MTDYEAQTAVFRAVLGGPPTEEEYRRAARQGTVLGILTSAALILAALLLSIWLTPAHATTNQVSGSLTAGGSDCSVTGRCVTLTTIATGNGTLEVRGTFTGTALLECSIAGLTYSTVPLYPIAGTASVTSLTAPGLWTFSGAFGVCRVRASAFSSGTATVDLLVTDANVRPVPSAGSLLSNPVTPAQGGTGGDFSSSTGVLYDAAGTFSAIGCTVGIFQGGAPPTCTTTPTTLVLTNATGLPINSGVSGLGTGVATALAINVGSAGAPVTFNGAGGTPSSLVGTNITGTAAGLTAGNASQLLGATWAAPGTIGSTTPNPGAFTTVTAAGPLTVTNASNAAGSGIVLATGQGRFYQDGTSGILASDTGAVALIGLTGATVGVGAAPPGAGKLNVLTGIQIGGVALASTNLSDTATLVRTTDLPLSGANGGTGVANTGKTITLGGNLVTSGAFAATFTLTGATGVTLPTSGTLATLAGTEALTNKSLNGMTVTASTGTFTLTNAKTLTVSNTLTFTGTDSSSVAFGAGGTVVYTGRTINTTSPITGGGDLSADRTFACATCGVTGSPLSQFAATTSAQFFGVISDETGGTGVVVGSVSPSITTPTFVTSATGPLLIGGTGTTSTLALRSTSGTGTTGADVIVQTGTNGGTEVARFQNGGNVGVGTASPASDAKLQVNGVLKVATANDSGVINVGDSGGAGTNAGIFRGLQNAIGGGNWLNLGGFAGINFATGSAALGSQTTVLTLTTTGAIHPAAFTFANIGTVLAANGDLGYCSDCTIANPCAGSGNGAIAKRLNGVNVCN